MPAICNDTAISLHVAFILNIIRNTASVYNFVYTDKNQLVQMQTTLQRKERHHVMKILVDIGFCRDGNVE